MVETRVPIDIEGFKRGVAQIKLDLDDLKNPIIIEVRPKQHLNFDKVDERLKKWAKGIDIPLTIDAKSVQKSLNQLRNLKIDVKIDNLEKAVKLLDQLNVNRKVQIRFEHNLLKDLNKLTGKVHKIKIQYETVGGTPVVPVGGGGGGGGNRNGSGSGSGSKGRWGRYVGQEEADRQARLAIGANPTEQLTGNRALEYDVQFRRFIEMQARDARTKVAQQRYEDLGRVYGPSTVQAANVRTTFQNTSQTGLGNLGGAVPLRSNDLDDFNSSIIQQMVTLAGRHNRVSGNTPVEISQESIQRAQNFSDTLIEIGGNSESVEKGLAQVFQVAAKLNSPVLEVLRTAERLADEMQSIAAYSANLERAQKSINVGLDDSSGVASKLAAVRRGDAMMLMDLGPEYEERVKNISDLRRKRDRVGQGFDLVDEAIEDRLKNRNASGQGVLSDTSDAIRTFMSKPEQLLANIAPLLGLGAAALGGAGLVAGTGAAALSTLKEGVDLVGKFDTDIQSALDRANRKFELLGARFTVGLFGGERGIENTIGGTQFLMDSASRSIGSIPRLGSRLVNSARIVGTGAASFMGGLNPLLGAGGNLLLDEQLANIQSFFEMTEAGAFKAQMSPSMTLRSNLQRDLNQRTFATQLNNEYTQGLVAGDAGGLASSGIGNLYQIVSKQTELDNTFRAIRVLSSDQEEKIRSASVFDPKDPKDVKRAAREYVDVMRSASEEMRPLIEKTGALTLEIGTLATVAKQQASAAYVLDRVNADYRINMAEAESNNLVRGQRSQRLVSTLSGVDFGSVAQQSIAAELQKQDLQVYIKDAIEAQQGRRSDLKGFLEKALVELELGPNQFQFGEGLTSAMRMAWEVQAGATDANVEAEAAELSKQLKAYQDTVNQLNFAMGQVNTVNTYNLNRGREDIGLSWARQIDISKGNPTLKSFQQQYQDAELTKVRAGEDYMVAYDAFQQASKEKGLTKAQRARAWEVFNKTNPASIQFDKATATLEALDASKLSVGLFAANQDAKNTGSGLINRAKELAAYTGAENFARYAGSKTGRMFLEDNATTFGGMWQREKALGEELDLLYMQKRLSPSDPNLNIEIAGKREELAYIGQGGDTTDLAAWGNIGAVVLDSISAIDIGTTIAENADWSKFSQEFEDMFENSLNVAGPQLAVGLATQLGAGPFVTAFTGLFSNILFSLLERAWDTDSEKEARKEKAKKEYDRREEERWSNFQRALDSLNRITGEVADNTARALEDNRRVENLTVYTGVVTRRQQRLF